MKRACFACLLLCLTTTLLLPQSNPDPRNNESAKVVPPISAPKADPKVQGKILDQYGKLPLSFEVNQGQTDSRVKFLSRTSGYSLFLTEDEAVLTLSGKKAITNKAKIEGAAHKSQSAMAAPKSGGVLRMKLRNANPAAKVTGVDELSGTSNYFIGNDPTKWRTNVSTYAKVKYEGIYSGIDLLYYGNQRQLEYDFIVAPGADPRRIAFDVRGAKRIRRDEHGDLVLKLGESEIRWYKPVAYQEKDGARREIAARYAFTEKNRVGFEVASYDPSRPLYIDPLIYSTYLGGSGLDSGNGIAVDSAGNAYVTGLTASTNFPTKNPLQPAFAGGFNCDCDAFVTKLSATGSALVYSTYLGGSGDDVGYGIAVDSAGNAYVTGYTFSTDFPTVNPLQPTNRGLYNVFVTEINPTGSALVYSTYLGGSSQDSGDTGYGIAVDNARNAYVTGQATSTDFPTTPGAFQMTGPGGFAAKLNPTGSALVYSTYLDGSGPSGIAVDSAGNAYVTGSAGSGFPTTPGAFQTTPSGGGDAFVTEFNPSGSALVYSTYLGGSGEDYGNGIAADSAGDAYVTGFTNSGNFPVTPGAFQTTCCGAFVTKVNPMGSALVYSTYLDGGSGYHIAVDTSGDAYVTGFANSGNFPVTPGAFQTICRRYRTFCHNAFVSKLNASGSVLVYSTFLGGTGDNYGNGIAMDSAGNAYVTGNTGTINFPTMNPLQPTYGGGYRDAFVTKIDVRAVTTATLSSSPNPSTYGQAVTFTGTVTSTIGAPPDGETVTFLKGTKVLGTETLNGGSASLTTSTLPVGNNSIKVVYGGDANFLGCTSKAVSQMVGKATTTTTLTSSLNPSNFGQSVAFKASVTPQFGGTVKGSVTFYDGATALKTVALSGGVAKFTTSTLASGAHNIVATYNGSANFIGSSASLTQTVN